MLLSARFKYLNITPVPSIGDHLKSTFGLLLLVTVIFLMVFLFVDSQKSGVENVELLRLLSFSNFYDDKEVCTRGYYVVTDSISIIKVSLDDDEFTRSAWVRILPDGEILKSTRAEPKKYIDAKICGLFETGRAQAFGVPPLWNHQLTASKFETFGSPKTYRGTY